MFGIYNPTSNAPERRPNAELLAKMPRRQEVYGTSAEDVVAVFARTQPQALQLPVANLTTVEAAPVVQVNTKAAGNVIQLAAKREASTIAARAITLSEQDQRIADARDATDDALVPHAPVVEKLLEELGYELAA